MGNAEQRAMARKELENDVASINCMGPEYFLSRVKVLFDKYDENHNGKLEWKEAKRFLRDVGEICHVDMPKAKSKKLFAECDTNKDGVISFSEFEQLIISAGVKATPSRS